MKKTNQEQQGDVLFTKLTEMPSGKCTPVKRDARGIVLAEGEATGHYHAIVEETDAELVMIGEKMLLSLKEPTKVTHHEHRPVTLDPGIWQIGQVREWDYLEQMERNVVD